MLPSPLPQTAPVSYKESDAPWWYLHRAGMHTKLVRVATKARQEGWTSPAKLKLNSGIVSCGPRAGSVVDQHCEVYTAT